MRFFFLLLFGFPMFGQTAFDAASVLKFQADLNAEFASEKESPLTEADREAFHGLDFFAPDADFTVRAKFVKSENEKPFEMKTTGSRKPMYVKFGHIEFTLQGKTCKLNIYRNIELSKKKEYENHLFLPFSDLSSGKETYIGGRYIDLEIPEGEEIVIDFNKAYNPYCAYNHKYSCPIVPLENDLDVAILAGVKKFHD